MTTYDTRKFLDLERQVWDALLTGDMGKDAMMLSDSFLGVYDSGFATKQEHVAELIAGPKISSYTLIQEKLMVLSENVILLSYMAEFSRIHVDPAVAVERMYVSSIWRKEQDAWKNVFSQDAPSAA